MDRDSSKVIIAILLCMEYLIGCSNPVTVPIRYNSEYKHKYVPITLNINSGKHRGELESELADYICESFRKSGLFLHIDLPPKNNSISFNINHSLNQPMNAGVLAGAMLSAATLLVLPIEYSELHTINVEILNEDKMIMDTSYYEEIAVTFSLFHNVLEARKEGLNKLLKKMFEEIDSKGILPSIPNNPQ